MENPNADKVVTVSEIKELLVNADAAILTEYRGMSVGELSALRRSLRTAGGEYRVFKNTLVRIAAEQAGIANLEPMLHGPTAVAFIKGDAVEAAKALKDFAKTNPKLIVKGGLLGSTVLNASQTSALADMPPKKQVLAELAGLFAAPLSQFASLLAAPPRDVAYAISALIDKQGGEPVAA
jgi:large subunit ribosomal protein L10